jgi:hypothetical protein
MRKLIRSAVLLSVSLATAAAGGSRTFAQGIEYTAFGAQGETGCRQSSYIPSLGPLTLRNLSGTTLAFQRSVHHGIPSVRVWVNGQFAGEHDTPFSADGGQIQARLQQKMRLETWLGQVRQVSKAVPYLLVCGEWFGDLP